MELMAISTALYVMSSLCHQLPVFGVVVAIFSMSNAWKKDFKSNGWPQEYFLIFVHVLSVKNGSMWSLKVSCINSHNNIKFFTIRYKKWHQIGWSLSSCKRVILSWRIKLLLILGSLISTPWSFMRTLCALNARNLTLEGVRIAWQLWISRMQAVPLKQKNLSVLTAAKYQWKTVLSMELISSSSSANSVVT